MHEELERTLVDYYNEYRPLFDSVPPYYSIPIPEAEINEDHERKEYKNTTFDVDSEKFKNNPHSPMSCSLNKKGWKTTIYVNPTYYHYSSNLSGLLLFPPLHEMVHVKQVVLMSKGFEFKCENFPTVDFSIMKELFEDLQSRKDEDFRRAIKEDGFECFVMCNYLAQELLKDEKFTRKIIGGRQIKASNQINWLTEHLYWFDRDEFNKEGGMRQPYPRIKWFNSER